MSKKTNIGPISATELMARLNQDPEFVRRSQEQALEFSVRKKRSAEAERPVVRALNDAGIAVNSLSDLVNTKRRYPTAIPVLLDHLVLPYPYPTRESIARALTTREAADGYRVLLDPLKAVAVLIDLLHDDQVAGHAVMALGKLKTREGREQIEHLLDHPQPWVRKEAKKVLAKWDG
jgi:HEAT repeat protein